MFLPVLTLLFSLFSHTQTEIKTIFSFCEAKEVLDSLDPESTVIFDVDDTLIVPTRKIFWDTNKEKHNTFFQQIYHGIFGNQQKPADYYVSILRQTEHPVLIEPIVLDIIHDLQQRGIKTFACSALPARSDHVIPYLPEWRIEKLREVGIDFTPLSGPNISLTTLIETSCKDTYHPIFYKGVICSGRLNKGVVIAEFFKTIGWFPKRVVFFDDRLNRVQEVMETMEKLGIPCVAYHYCGEELLDGSFDKELVTFQMQYLVEHETWLDDTEAQLYLENQLPIMCNRVE